MCQRFAMLNLFEIINFFMKGKEKLCFIFIEAQKPQAKCMEEHNFL